MGKNKPIICPICLGRRVSKDNNLLKKFPKIGHGSNLDTLIWTNTKAGPLKYSTQKHGCGMM